MATNNHTREEPLTTTLKRQVQTLDIVVECLIEWNYDLKERLCQRDAGPNSHEEE